MENQITDYNWVKHTEIRRHLIFRNTCVFQLQDGQNFVVGMLEHLLARIVDRRIGFSKGGQIQYVVVGYLFRFICESLSQLHVCNTYRNILIILVMSDTGKVCQVLNLPNFELIPLDIAGFLILCILNISELQLYLVF